jgi:hypothetical protein
MGDRTRKIIRFPHISNQAPTAFVFIVCFRSNPKTGVDRDREKTISNLPSVGRATPCAPRLQPADPGFSQTPFANPLVQNDVPYELRFLV